MDRRSSATSVENVDIVFDNPDSLYFAGQKLAGKIVIELTGAVSVNDILVEIRGGAKTYWTKYGGHSRKHYRDTEPYFCEQFSTGYTEQYRVGTASAVLPRGKHEIPFFYRLAENLPSSFEGEFGFVRYTCKVIMERPWESDLVCKRAFTVAGEENLPEEKTGLARISKSETHSFFTCCLRRGLVKIKIALPKSYYVPGEALEIELEVNNESRSTLRCCSICLSQCIRYFAKDFSGKEHWKMVKTELLNTANFCVSPWRSLDRVDNLPLPPVPPKLTRCKIIEVTYSCDFCTNRKVLMSVPITLGTITPRKLMRVKLAEARMGAKHPENHLHQALIPEYNKWAEKISIRNSILGEVTVYDPDKGIQFGSLTYVPKYPCLVTNYDDRNKEPSSK